MPVAAYTLTVLVAYLLGSIPTGFLLARARGVDIRAVGSGNIGATNVFRQLGIWAGIAVLVADVLKGLLAVTLIALWFGQIFYPDASPQAREWLRIMAGLSAVLGHNYTCWLHFKGGKGIATSAGVLIGLMPWALAIIAGVWLIVFALKRYVSLASICAAAALPFATWITGGSFTLIILASAMAVLAIYKHKPNIKRLLSGTESRLGAAKHVSSPQANETKT